MSVCECFANILEIRDDCWDTLEKAMFALLISGPVLLNERGSGVLASSVRLGKPCDIVCDDTFFKQ